MAGHKNLVAAIVILACVGWDMVTAHTMGLGSCPKVEPLKDFNMEKVRMTVFELF